MDKFGVNITGDARIWYDHIACDECRARFATDIQNVITQALECFHNATHYPYGALREAHRIGLIGRRKMLSMPIADFKLESIVTDGMPSLSLVDIETYPDCKCMIMH